MLGVSTYPKPYIEACRKRFERQLAAFRALKSGPELKAFEPLFFSHMVLALDHCFVHRLRGKEGKDGNPMNELRMLADSILENDGVLDANSTIKYDAKTAVLKIGVGEKIALDAKAFEALAEAFFAAIRAKFS